jgi:hypothetical protein
MSLHSYALKHNHLFNDDGGNPEENISKKYLLCSMSIDKYSKTNIFANGF